MQDSQDHRYEMSISLGILDHLGLNLYSNTPAVISEVIANAWDADATRVEITIDTSNNTITVTDNGHGMDLEEINRRYLLVGYRRRDEQGSETFKGRRPMGRKGIGKLSLFSIAEKIFIHTKKAESGPEAFLMDALEIRRTVEEQEAAARASGETTTPRYYPQTVSFDGTGLFGNCGTTVKITQLKMNITGASVAGLRKRIARRFGLLADDFEIVVNDDPVGFTDRDYFHKARFIFQYGNYDYATHCPNLDRPDGNGEPRAFFRESRFGADGVSDPDGEHEIKGWIAIARHSNDLDDRASDNDDNLNKITILMRGKVAQEDILGEYRLGGMITKFIFGEIHADFLDVDTDDDIATTSRQHLAEDHPRYVGLKRFVEGELRHIWTQTNKLKDRRELHTAISSNPYVKEWYENLGSTWLKESARSVFQGIDVANMDDEYRHGLYATAVLAFEHLKMNNALNAIQEVDASNIEVFLNWLADMDAIEASRYFEIVSERLAIIDTLQEKVNDNDYEKILQEYIFDHLWLLDPAWERATEYQEMERQIQNAVDRVPIRNKDEVRPDIRYRRISGMHVIIELKRPSVSIRKTAIEDQVRDYIEAVKREVRQDPAESRYPIEAICMLGTLPIGWDNPQTRELDEDSLRGYGIRVMTYQQLINHARSAYAKFVKARASLDDLSKTVEAIRSYRRSQDS